MGTPGFPNHLIKGPDEDYDENDEEDDNNRGGGKRKGRKEGGGRRKKVKRGEGDTEWVSVMIMTLVMMVMKEEEGQMGRGCP